MEKPLILAAVSDLFFMSKIRSALETQGYNVRFERGPEEILKSAAGTKPVLLVLDLGLASAGWEDFFPRLREVEGMESLPVLGFTNHTQVPYWEGRLKDRRLKVVANSLFSLKIWHIVDLLSIFDS